MFTLYHSNQLDLLKELLVSRIRQAPLSHPSIGSRSWCRVPAWPSGSSWSWPRRSASPPTSTFPLPASFIWEMFTRVLAADVPRQSPYNKGAMSWHLMTILPALLAVPPLPLWVGASGGRWTGAVIREQVRLWQLCQKVADLFDQYLVYRPDWIARWEEGKD